MRIVFRAPDGGETETQGDAGQRLLDVAQAADQPLEGTCNGMMACGTCLVTLAAEALALFPPASDEEEDMLDLLPQATRNSRLSCQLRLAAGSDGLVVTLPAAD